VSEDDQKVRELFREAAKKEGKSLRQWCRDNGIVTPLSAIHDHDGTYFGVCPACAKE